MLNVTFASEGKSRRSIPRALKVTAHSQAALTISRDSCLRRQEVSGYPKWGCEWGADGNSAFSRAHINGAGRGGKVLYARRRHERLSWRGARRVGKAAGKRETRCILPLRLDMVKRAAERCRRAPAFACVRSRTGEMRKYERARERASAAGQSEASIRPELFLPFFSPPFQTFPFERRTEGRRSFTAAREMRVQFVREMVVSHAATAHSGDTKYYCHALFD